MAEKKFKEFQYSAWNTGATPGVTTAWQFVSLINGVPVGTGENERIGGRIFVRHIDCVFSVKNVKTTAMTSGSFCRVIAVHNKATNASIIANTDFAIGPTGAIDVYSDLLFKLRPKYTMLADRVHEMVTFSATNGGPQTRWTMRIPVNKQIQYISSSGVATTSVNLPKDDYNIGVCATEDQCCEIKIFWRVVYNDA